MWTFHSRDPDSKHKCSLFLINRKINYSSVRLPKCRALVKWEVDISVCGGVVGVDFPKTIWECWWRWRMLTCYPKCPGLGFWVPLSIKRNQGSLGKGILPGLGQGKYKRSRLGKLTMAGSEEVLVKRWGWIGPSQEPAWGSHSHQHWNWWAREDEEERVCVHSAYLPTTCWPVTEGQSLGRNQMDSLYQRFTVNTTDPWRDAENTASLFVPSCPKCTT